LVPIISPNDYDAKASQILGKYYPEALKAPVKIDPEKLAERMGFMVIDRRLSLDGSVFGQVFFEDTPEAVFYAEDGTAFEESVTARTIVVDRRINRISSPGSENITIAHECVHAALHKTAFKFAKSFNKDIHCIQCEMMPDDEQRSMRSRTLLWIESQANAIAPHLLMPAEPFKTEADSIYGRLSKEPGFDPLDFDAGDYSGIGWVFRSDGIFGFQKARRGWLSDGGWCHGLDRGGIRKTIWLSGWFPEGWRDVLVEF
jgi:hypothetical protein